MDIECICISFLCKYSWRRARECPRERCRSRKQQALKQAAERNIRQQVAAGSRERVRERERWWWCFIFIRHVLECVRVRGGGGPP